LRIALFVISVPFAVTGLLILYGSVRPSDRWPSRSHRAAGILTGATMVTVAVAFVAAAATSGGTHTDLLIAGGLAGVAGAVSRWLVRWRWEAKQ
jgi:hypothetical protein